MVPNAGPAGAWRGPCVLCLNGTDTGMLLQGEAQWLVGAISQLGVSPERAATMVTASFAGQRCDPGLVPAGRQEMLVSICSRCAAAAGVPTAPGQVVRDEAGMGRIAAPVPRFVQPPG
jgi:hypothetical protein